MIVDELIAILGYDIRGESQRRRFVSSLDAINAKVGAFAVAATRMAAVASGVLAAGFGVAARSITNVTAEFETYEATLKTIEGTAEGARQSMDWITEFAAKTPYAVNELTQSFVKLKAYGIDPIANDTMRVLGDTSAAMGKTLNDAVEAFADASTGEFERLKEFGVTTKQQGDEVVFSWTQNGESLTRVVKKQSNDIRMFLLENFGSRFAGAMDEQSRTYKGLISNLGDNFVNFQRRIGEAGYFDAVKERLEGLLEWLDRMEQNGNLDRWAQGISDAMVTVMDAVTGFGQRMFRHFETIRDLWSGDLAGFGEWKNGIITGLALVMRALFPVATAFLVAFLAMEDFLTYLEGGESVIGAAVEWMQEFLGVSEGVAEALVAVAAGFALIVAYAGPITVLSTAVKGLAGSLAMFGGGGAAGGLGFLGKLRSGLMGAGAAAALVGGFAASNKILDYDASLNPQRMEDAKKNQSGSSADLPDWARDMLGPNGQASKQNFIDGAAASDPGNWSAPQTLQDLRDQSVQQTNNITINQNVQQATDAPRAAAEATGASVGSSVRKAVRAQQEGAQ